MVHAFRGPCLDFVADPFLAPEAESLRYLADGLLVVADDGTIADFGPATDLAPRYAAVPTTAYPDRLLLPGLIDTHIHFPQTGMMAAYGEQLMSWLHQYTFPTERKFADPDYARTVADLFLDELLRHGTTTALVMATVFPQSAEALFEAALARNLRLIAGKVMMDRNAPDYLCDTAENSYTDSKALIERWHGQGRLLYAVTPRFAVTSSAAQMAAAARLLAEYPGVYLHTHLSENVDEVALVRQMFPQCQHYVDVYDQAGLVGDRSVFAHGVQLSEAEFTRLGEAGAAISFCPTSNLFLGSGLFNLAQAKSPHRPVKVGLGTDVGAGTSFSLLCTLNEAYKVGQLQRQSLSPFQGLFLATLGGAQALGLADQLGNFAPGKEADFIVLDPQATPLLAFRNPRPTAATATELADLAFTLMMLGDDRVVSATYILGQRWRG